MTGAYNLRCNWKFCCFFSILPNTLFLVRVEVNTNCFQQNLQNHNETIISQTVMKQVVVMNGVVNVFENKICFQKEFLNIETEKLYKKINN